MDTAVEGITLPLRKFLMGDAVGPRAPDSAIWLMGRCYGPFCEEELEDRYGEYQRFLRDLYSRLWFTYRSGFEPIRAASYTTDTGWGCMLRSGQMLLGEALIRHILPQDWLLGHNMRETVLKYSEIMSWFLVQNSPQSPFSLHHIALEGERYDKHVGEWFGPSTISSVIRDLVQRHRPYGMTAYVAQDGVVYKDKLLELTSTPPPPGSQGAQSQQKRASPLIKDTGLQSASTDSLSSNSGSDASAPFYSVLILVPLRLGLEYLNEIYEPALKKCFEFPQSVGIAGGRPNSSLFFVASDSAHLYFLDPHFTRPVVEAKPLSQYTEYDWRSYHCPEVRRIHISRIDPSLLLGFYCHTRQDLDDFFQRVDKNNAECASIFSVADELPRYYDDDELDSAESGGAGSTGLRSPLNGHGRRHGGFDGGGEDGDSADDDDNHANLLDNEDEDYDLM